jgi:hypothetical protein
MGRLVLFGTILIAISTPACDPGASSPPNTPPTTPPSPVAGVGIIGPSGGTAVLPSVAEVTFPAGSVPGGTRVEISEVPTPSSSEAFDIASTFAAASNISNRAVEVLVGGPQPTGAVQIKLFVSQTYISGLPAGHKVRVLALSTNTSDLEAPSSTYEILPVTVNATDSSIGFTVSREFFTSSSSSSSIARFVVASSL